MGNFFSSRSSLTRITEIFAFPFQTANACHEKVELSVYEAPEDEYYEPPLKKVCYYKIDKGSKNAIIFCHGNCMTVTTTTIEMIRSIADNLNTTIYMLEYPGYGESFETGAPTAESCVRALNLLAHKVKLDHPGPDQIYIMGHSIGSGVAAQFAFHSQHYRYGGLILISPFKSILSVVIPSEALEMSSSSLNFYETHNIIADIDMPILIVHGINDKVIDVSHSEELADKSSRVSCKYINCGHNDILMKNSLMSHVNLFLSR
jgi:pimeloyl-ACP methyl ester carboxylesterase